MIPTQRAGEVHNPGGRGTAHCGREGLVGAARRTLEVAGELEWQARLGAAVERSVRQRAARDERRRVLAARRSAGLQARQATRLARLDTLDLEAPCQPARFATPDGKPPG